MKMCYLLAFLLLGAFLAFSDARMWGFDNCHSKFEDYVMATCGEPCKDYDFYISGRFCYGFKSPWGVRFKPEWRVPPSTIKRRCCP